MIIKMHADQCYVSMDIILKQYMNEKIYFQIDQTNYFENSIEIKCPKAEIIFFQEYDFCNFFYSSIYLIMFHFNLN